MTLQTDIQAAEQAVQVANDNLSALKAQLEAAQPHITLWADLKSWVENLGDGVKTEFSAFEARAKAILNID
jgi:hypothetical protein